MLWTIDNALRCSRYQNLIHRHCDIVEIANRSNLAYCFCGGIIQPNNHTYFKTPTYYAQELYANHAGRYPLKIHVEGAAAADQTLDVSATLAEDENRIAIFVVNTSLAPQKRVIDLSPFAPLAEEADVGRSPTLLRQANATPSIPARTGPHPHSIGQSECRRRQTRARVSTSFVDSSRRSPQERPIIDVLLTGLG